MAEKLLYPALVLENGKYRLTQELFEATDPCPYYRIATELPPVVVCEVGEPDANEGN